MAFLFDVCSQCVANYRALVHDPDAECSFCQIPFDCIMWSDEHPPAMTIFNRGHQACSYSVMRLVSARKWLWRTGQIPAELEQVWRGAQETIPDWPGFRRLTLSAEEMQDLDSCEEETASLMDSLRSDASTFAVSDEGGGVAHFSAHLPAPPTTDEARPPQSGDSTPPGGSHSVN